MREGFLIHVKATAPAESDWHTLEMCEELSMLGMIQVRLCEEDGVFVAEIGHIIEEAMSNLYPDREVEPHKAAARALYEEYLVEKEIAELEAEDPGFSEWQAAMRKELLDLMRDRADER